MPTKRKHIPKHIAPVGASKDGKLKVKDGDTGKESWRQGLKGFSQDWDGDPIARQYNKKDMKKKPKHQVHMGHKHNSVERRGKSSRNREE